MDGLEATIELRRREQDRGGHMPVVAMTALAMKGDKERCLDAGMDGYLSKPIRPEELDDILDRYTAKGKTEPAPAEDAESTDCVNVEELLERVDGDRAFIAELAEIFREDYPRQIQALREGVISVEPDKVRCAAHALKGALSNLAATQASSLAASLEAKGRSGDLAGTARVVDQLESELQLVDRRLHSICPELVG
jgi:CheY-like chemotaxis protein